MPKPDEDNKLDQELIALRKAVPTLSSQEIDRDLAEVLLEIRFLEEQLRNDLRSYSGEGLERANARVSHFKKRAEILKIELDRRNSDVK